MGLTKIPYRMVSSSPASVLDFGAKGDGVTDDTSAFNNALAASNYVYVPSAKYVVGDVVVPSGATLFSDSARLEAQNNSSYGEVWLIRKSGATTVLNVSDSTGVKISGINIDGIDKTCYGISAGSVLLTLENVCITRCSNGFGGSIGGGSAYTSAASIYFSTFRNCTNGATNLIDSVVNGGAFTANENGVALGSGATANTFIGVRFEWNTAYGADLYQAGLNNFSGGMFDRNFKAGVRIYSSSDPITFSATEFRRNGRNNVYLQNAHVLLGDASNIVFTGIGTKTGKDDDGTGTLSPAYVVTFVNTNSNISIDGALDGFVSGFSNGFYPTEFTKKGTGILQIITTNIPSTATSTGEKGTICWDTNYIYICTATNTWKRSAISTW